MTKYTFCLFSLFTSLTSQAQPIDFTNFPSCTTTDIEQVKEINTKYLGIQGKNPSVPSTYKLIGDRKFSGEGWGWLSPVFGKNWYPIRIDKQIFSGKFDHYAVNTYGDESDWDIYLLPNPGFDNFINEALPFKPLINIWPHKWPTSRIGEKCVEAEITPPNAKYGNTWFNNIDNSKFIDAFYARNYLLGKNICAYGPFVREESHGNHPEIHPSELIWWKENDNLTNVLLVGDGSNRFNDMNDYSTRDITSQLAKAWSPTTKLEAELKIPFSIEVSKENLFYNINVTDDYNFYNDANYTDVSSGVSHKIKYEGNIVLTVTEPVSYDSKIGVTFSNVCFNRQKGVLQGFIVINTATGNGNGREGFVLLQIDKRETRLNKKPVLKWGNLLNSWTTFNSQYDSKIYFESIISSDKTGKGIVDGIIDFNGNGITDFFAVKGGNWMVLYDGKGDWIKINQSYVPVNVLRFGDVNGDKKTDVLFSNLRDDVRISYSGTENWTTITKAPKETDEYEESKELEPPPPRVIGDINVADFDGDGKTDIFYLDYHDQDKADMYVKYDCKGEWQRLNRNYHMKFGDFEKYFRLGHFNKDKKTDIFRYDDNQFLVYWGGGGDYSVLNKKLPADLKPNNLLFANNFTQLGITDVIYVDQENKNWTKYDGGGPGTLPMPMDFANPDKIHFGNVKGNTEWEAFVLDYVPQTGFSEDVKFIEVVKIETEPFVITEYEKGSIRRVVKNEQPSFVIDISFEYIPGSSGAEKKKTDFTTITKTLEKKGKQLKFQAANEPADIDKLGTLREVSLETNDNEVIVEFASDKMNFKVPAYTIGAINGPVTQTSSGAGNWQNWKTYLWRGTPVSTGNMFDAAPASPEKIGSVEFEILPFYSAKIAGSVSMVEMGEPQEDLNRIAYGSDEGKITELFGSRKVFTIKWKFEITNLTTGTIVVADRSFHPSITTGKWENSKLSFSFPASNDVLQVKAVATITDVMGLSSQPVEFLFFNQQIKLKNAENQIQQWISSFRNINPAKLKYYKTRIGWLAEDAVLTPEEMKMINN